jgi:hypothetical protein
VGKWGEKIILDFFNRKGRKALTFAAVKLLNKEQNPKECDATMMPWKTEAGNKK